MNMAECPEELNDLVMLIGFSVASRRCIDVYLPDFKCYRISPEEVSGSSVSESYKVLWLPRCKKWIAVMIEKSLVARNVLPASAQGWVKKTVQATGERFIVNSRNEVRIQSEHLENWVIMQTHLCKQTGTNWGPTRRILDLVKPTDILLIHSAPVIPPIYRRIIPLDNDDHTIAGNFFYAQILDKGYEYVEPSGTRQYGTLECHKATGDAIPLYNEHNSALCRVRLCPICRGRLDTVEEAVEDADRVRRQQRATAKPPAERQQMASMYRELRSNKCRGWGKNCDEDVVHVGTAYCYDCAKEKTEDR
jgi:hypothetical protein